jgi:sucrose phosphorylase
LREHVRPDLHGGHILPVVPWSSDDGLSVTDYDAADPALGGRDDVASIGQELRLTAHLMLTHCSAQSDRIQGFLGGDPARAPDQTASVNDDLGAMVRPRPHPILTRYEGAAGLAHVWRTFVADQVDLTFGEPEAPLEFIAILRRRIDHGARIIRLDAVGFLRKEGGAPSIHPAPTHEVVRLMCGLMDNLNVRAVLLTEINAPHAENLSYFGNQNEAHAIYYFSLAPLRPLGLLRGGAAYLRRWLMAMPSALPGCAHLNFAASHDGIGVLDVSGAMSMRTRDGVKAPHEIDAPLWFALAGAAGGAPDAWRFERFIPGRTVMMSIAGILAFYIHSLLAAPNDREGRNLSGRNRAINRREWDRATWTPCWTIPPAIRRACWPRSAAASRSDVAIRRRDPAA